MQTLFAFSREEIAELAEGRETPFFAYRRPVAREAFLRLRASLPGRVRLAYAVKANPHGGLLSCLAEAGASFDCASDGELRRLRDIGVTGKDILFAGPGKTLGELELAASMGARVQVDGTEDLARLQAIAEKYDRKFEVNLRVHPLGMPSEDSAIIGGSAPSAFGVDEENLGEFLAAASRFDRVSIRGMQTFTASNERSAARLLEKHRITLDLARRLASLGVAVGEIDLGGGLGIPYAPEESPFDVEAFGEGLTGLLAENRWFDGNLVVEPGRFLAGPCGVYVTRVTRVKRSRGKLFAVLEGGINHLARPLLTGQPFPVVSLAKGRSEVAVTLAGPLCTSLDRLGETTMAEPEPGDILAFGQAGAYGFTEAMQGFLSRKPAAECWIDR